MEGIHLLLRQRGAFPEAKDKSLSGTVDCGIALLLQAFSVQPTGVAPLIRTATDYLHSTVASNAQSELEQ